MPPIRRTPWIAIDVDGRKDDKVVDLPSDSARYGYFLAVLTEARLQDPRGVFASRSVIAEAIGRFDKYVPNYVSVGLLHTAPLSCESCRNHYGDGLKRGALVVHNWHAKQHDPGHAERQARHRAARNGHAPAERDGDAERDAKVTPRTVTTTSHGDDEVTGYSRARALTPSTSTDTREEDPSSGVTPRATNGGTSSASPRDERPDVAALRAMGWRQVSDAQVAILDEVSDYERASEYDVVSGQRVVAQWIRDAIHVEPNELLTHVMATSRRLRDERQRIADQRTELGEQHKRATLHPAIGGAT